MSVPSTYEIYLRSRKSKDPQSFRAMRETVARQLAVDSSFKDRYLQRLSHHAYGFAPTYADIAQFAECGQVGPTLVEATKQTIRRTQAIQKVCEELEKTDTWSFAIIGGSFPWKQYNLLSANSASDIDITAIFDQLPPKMNVTGEADMSKFKLDINGIPISLHVWTSSLMKRIAATNFSQLDRTMLLSCLREYEPASNSSFYGPQYNFAGDAHYLPRNLRTGENSKLFSDQHIGAVGMNGEFVMGTSLDMILFGSEVVGPKAEDFSHMRHSIINSLRSRMHLDAQRLNNRPLSFANLPHNRLQMPQWLLEEIRRWDKEE